MILLSDGAAHVASVLNELSLGALLIHGIGLDEIIERYKSHKKKLEDKSQEGAVTSVLEAQSLEATMNNPEVLEQLKNAFKPKNTDRADQFSLMAKWSAFFFTIASMVFIAFHGIVINQSEYPSDECRTLSYFIFSILGFSSTVLLYHFSDRMKTVTRALDESDLRNFNGNH